MIKKLVSFSLGLLLLHIAGGNHFQAVAQSQQDGPALAKVRADVAKRGLGEKARVRVKLHDGSKLKGYISQAGGDSFVLTDSKTGQTRTLAYGDVAQVRKPGGLSLAAKIGIGLGAAVGVMAILYAGACGGNDNYC